MGPPLLAPGSLILVGAIALLAGVAAAGAVTVAGTTFAAPTTSLSRARRLAGDPYELPRQRRGRTPQMHGRYPDYDVL